MEELQPEELEELVKELEGESEQEEALSPEVELLLGYLEQAKSGTTRLRAAERLGKLRKSSPRTVQSLIAAAESDSSLGVRETAMESLRAPAHQELLQEYPDLVQRAQAATQGLSPEVESLLRRLGPWSPELNARGAAEQLGKVRTSSPRIVQALIKACESSSVFVSRAAAKSLRAPVHQECLQQHPKLAAAAASALQRDLDLREMARGAPVQRRIYPELIQGRPLGLRIVGVLFALIGLGLLVLSAVGVINLALGLVGLGVTYIGLLAAGLVLKEFLLALRHRRAWQGPQVTVDGRITDREIEKHEHESDYGGVSYTYTYWVTFGFPATEGQVRLKTEVVEERYDQLKRGQPVKVRYAQEDPRLAILEWESDW